MNTNDLVYKIAEKAKKLADDSMFGLRLQVAQGDAYSPSSLRREMIGKSRGDMVEEILIEEFCEEFPKQIAED